jgi:hypothetical protein
VESDTRIGISGYNWELEGEQMDDSSILQIRRSGKKEGMKRWELCRGDKFSFLKT